MSACPMHPCDPDRQDRWPLVQEPFSDRLEAEKWVKVWVKEKLLPKLAADGRLGSDYSVQVVLRNHPTHPEDPLKDARRFTICPAPENAQQKKALEAACGSSALARSESFQWSLLSAYPHGGWRLCSVEEIKELRRRTRLQEVQSRMGVVSSGASYKV